MTGTRPSHFRTTCIFRLGLLTVMSAAAMGGERLLATPRGPGLGQAVQAQGGAPSGGRQGGSGFQGGWWTDPAIKAEIKLTDEQARRIKEIFEKREVEIKPLADMLNREGDRLDRMTRERAADEVTYSVQVTKVESLYGRLRESRTMMIYRMYRELQPEQYKKLQEILDRRRSARGSGPR